MSQNLQNFVKFQKFQLENLVDFEKCCKTHIFLQKSEPIQPKTSNILPKFCQPTLSDVASMIPQDASCGARPAVPQTLEDTMLHNGQRIRNSDEARVSRNQSVRCNRTLSLKKEEPMDDSLGLGTDAQIPRVGRTSKNRQGGRTSSHGVTPRSGA